MPKYGNFVFHHQWTPWVYVYLIKIKFIKIKHLQSINRINTNVNFSTFAINCATRNHVFRYSLLSNKTFVIMSQVYDFFISAYTPYFNVVTLHPNDTPI